MKIVLWLIIYIGTVYLGVYLLRYTLEIYTKIVGPILKEDRAVIIMSVLLITIPTLLLKVFKTIDKYDN